MVCIAQVWWRSGCWRTLSLLLAARMDWMDAFGSGLERTEGGAAVKGVWGSWAMPLEPEG